MKLMAGFGKADVSPPPNGGGMDLRILGFWYERDKPYGPVHDPLYARAAAFAAGEDVVCLVSVDMIGDGEGFGAIARGRIEKALRIPAERVVIACTHSHTTPTAAFSDRPANDEWLNQLAGGILDATQQAVRSLKPCTLSLAEGTLSGVALNRRLQSCREAICALQSPEKERHGLLDETLRVAVARQEDGSTKGLVVNYACHPVTVQTQPIISADFPGAAMSLLEKRAGVSLFTNGGCGDVNPVRVGSFEDVEWTGRKIAAAAEEVMDSTGGMKPGELKRVRALRRRISLPRREIPAAKDLEREASRLEAEAVAVGPFDPKTMTEHPGRELFMVNEQLAVARMPDRIEAEIQAIEIGEWLLVGIPGEIVGCLAADIRRAASAHKTWVVGYANGYIGYILTRDAFEVGGYEVRPGRWSCLAPGAGETLRDAAVELIRELES